MRKKRTIFGNRRINSYVSLPQYFETANGKELWEYLKSTKPLCLIFLTRGGYVVDVQFKKFVDINNGESIEIDEIKNSPPIDAEYPVGKSNPLFTRPPDPIKNILESSPQEQSTQDEEELKVGDSVKYRDGKVIFIGKVIGIDETKEEVIINENESVHKIKFSQLISIV